MHITRYADIDEKGDRLIEWIISCNLANFNKRNKPISITRYRQEVLDVTFISDDISGRIFDKAELRKYKSELRKAPSNSWVEFCNSVEDTS